MTAAQQAADQICAYLTMGMHHSTPEGRIAIAAIIAGHLHSRAVEQAHWWEDCTRDILRDKDQQIAALTARP